MAKERLDFRVDEDVKNKIIELAKFNSRSITGQIENMIKNEYTKMKGLMNLDKLEILKKKYDEMGYRITMIDTGHYIIVSKKLPPIQFDIRDYETHDILGLELSLDYYEELRREQEEESS